MVQLLTKDGLGQKGNGGVLRLSCRQDLLVVLVHKLKTLAESLVLFKHIPDNVVGGFTEVLDTLSNKLDVAAGLLGNGNQVVLAVGCVNEHRPGNSGFDLQEADAVTGFGSFSGENALGTLVKFEGLLLDFLDEALDIDGLLLLLFVFELFDKVFACNRGEGVVSVFMPFEKCKFSCSVVNIKEVLCSLFCWS